MSIVILDQFTDTNGTRLHSHTIAPTNVPSTSWTERNSSVWEINGSNQAFLNSNGGVSAENQADCDGGVADTTWLADLTTSGTGNTLAGILANWDGVNSNGFALVLRSDTQTCEIYQIDFNAFTSKASVSFTVASATTYHLKIVTSGDTITGYVNGTQEVQYTGSPRSYKTKTQGGLWIYSGFAIDVTWDNFQIGVAAAGGVKPWWWYASQKFCKRGQ